MKRSFALFPGRELRWTGAVNRKRALGARFELAEGFRPKQLSATTLAFIFR